MRHLWVSAAVLAVCVAPSPAAAQGDAVPAVMPFSVGARARVAWGEVPKPLSGVVVGVDENVLTLAPAVGAPFKVPLASLTRAELSLGHRRHWLHGLAIGAAAGLLVGLVVPVEAADCGPESSNFCSRGEALFGGAVGFGGLGTLVGGLVKTERWTPVSVGSRPGPAVTSGPGGLRLAVTFRF